MVKLNFSKNKDDVNSPCSKTSKTSKNKDIEKVLRPFSSEFHTSYEEPNDLVGISETPIVHLEPITIKNCNEIVGFENFEYYFRNWYSNSINFLMVIGPTGCGKSTFIELFCKENSVNLYTVKQNEFIKTKTQLLSDIINFIEYTGTSGNSFFNQDTTGMIPINKLILIDEYSNTTNDIFSISDIHNLLALRKGSKLTQTAKTDLIKFFNGTNISKENIIKLKIPPVVIISADSKGSKISELKKSLDVYYIQEIPRGLILDFTKTVAAHFGFKNDQLVTKITTICKSDKRLIINTLSYLSKESGYLSKESGSNNDDKKKLELFIDTFYKDEDVNIYDFVHKLFDNVEPIDLLDIYKTYHNDGYIISNLVHENYLDYSSDIDNLANAIDSISYADTINLYEHSMLLNPEIHCIYSLHIPSYHARSDVKNNKGNVRTSMISNKYNTYLNNKKTIDKINNNLINLLSIDEIYSFKKFLNVVTKAKETTSVQNDFLKGILSRMNEISNGGDLLDNGIEKLEMIYKYLSDFKINQESTTKQKTLSSKFKQKLMLINLNKRTTVNGTSPNRYYN